MADTTDYEELDENVTFCVQGNHLYLDVFTGGKRTVSASGKSDVVASTHGNVVIPGTDGLTIGLNAYFKRGR